MPETKNIEQRLAATETDVRHLAETVETLARGINHLRDDVMRKLEDYSSKGAITWPVIFTAIGTLLACMTIAGMVHAMSLQPLAEGIARNSIAQLRHESLEGHPESIRDTAVLRNDVDRIDNELETLDTTLQREMRLLDDTGQSRIDHLDTLLQREMRLLLDSRAVEAQAMKERVSTIEQWVADHDKHTLGLNAAQWERIRALERAEYGDAQPISHGEPRNGQVAH